MMRILLCIFLFILLTTSPVYAFFCPNNFNQIELGNSQEQIEQQCGKPDKQTSKEMTEEGAQAWDYYVSQNVLLNDNQPAQGTLKTSIVFDDQDHAINISVNGLGVGSSSICGSMIKLGDTRDEIKKACGDPAFINKQTPKDKEKKYTVTEFTYGKTIFIFQNGQLKETK